MSKILCLYSNKTSSWVSCQKIVANLWQSYLAATKDAYALHFGPEQKGQDLIKLAQEIIELKPDSISFIDHRPHPFDLLQYLIPRWMEKYHSFPQLTFHIYGDFTLNYHKWNLLAHMMKGIKTKFCVASTAQKKLMEKLIPQKIYLMPFAVDEKEFHYDESLRVRVRKDLKVTDDQKVFIFTGRLSYQKNIHLLVKAFLDYLEQINSRDQLLIFGHFDDLGDSFSGYNAVPGHYYHQVQKLLASHPKREQIRFMGMASASELKAYYNGSDFFINLSTHNDEDFGMSLAEASFCGLASIMSAWGGLLDFNFPPNRYLNVSINPRKNIDLSHFNDLLLQPATYNKEELSQLASQRFSISAVGLNKLREILNYSGEPFQEFTELFYKVQRSTLYTEKTYLDAQYNLNSLYQELYAGYLR